MRAIAKADRRDGHDAAQPRARSRRTWRDLKEAAVQQEAKDKAVTLAAHLGRGAPRHHRGRAAEPPQGQGPRKAPAQDLRRRPMPASSRAAGEACASPSSAKDRRPARAARDRQHRAAEEITFGEVVVTPPAQALSGCSCAVPSLARGPARDAGTGCASSTAVSSLRWSRASCRRAPDGGAYRLLAGPFATKADADRVCTDMGARRAPGASPRPTPARRCTRPASSTR